MVPRGAPLCVPTEFHVTRTPAHQLPRADPSTAPPARGADLVGWRAECTYKTGDEVRWHEGVVIRYQTTTADGRGRRGASERYQIAFSDGMSEWVDRLPEPGIAFRMRGDDARVSRAMLDSALRAHSLA